MDKKNIQKLITFESDDTSTGYINAGGRVSILESMLGFINKTNNYMEVLKNELWEKFIELFETYADEGIFIEDSDKFLIFKLDEPIEVTSAISKSSYKIISIDYCPKNKRLIFAASRKGLGLEKYNSNAQELLTLLNGFVTELRKRI